MSTFEYNGKTYDTDDRKSGQSKREYYSSITGGSKNDYEKSKESGDVSESFEETYDDEAEEEDMEKSKEMWTEHYEQKIDMELEDLNDFVANSNVNYQRTLRTARNSYAKMGGAIGSEREGGEAEIKQDNDSRIAGASKQAERNVGTEGIEEAGYASSGLYQEGSLVQEMEGAIENEVLDLKNERADTYYAKNKGKTF